MTEMCVEKGFSRRDGTDYFTHPIALAQRGLDMGIIDDVLLASSLLHDIVEDVEHIDIDYITFEFGEEVAEAVDTVTKRDGEEYVDYVKRFTSKEKSLMLKLLDRLHNISTLNGSSLEQRKKQYEETSKVFLPITKAYRRIYWENATFFNIARNELQGYLAEIKRSIESEEEI